MRREFSFMKHFLQICQHAFADAGNGEHLLWFTYEVCNLLRQGFYSFGSVAVRTDAKRVLAVDLHQVGGLIENPGNRLVVHEERLKQSHTKEEVDEQTRSYGMNIVGRVPEKGIR